MGVLLQMKLSTRFRYGTRALVELAVAYPRGAVSVNEVARTQRVSAKYLEHIMSALRLAGVVQSVRGLGGGYELARPPAEIRLVEIYEILEGPCAPVACVDAPGSCPMSPICATRDTWAELKAAIRGVLAHKTLEDLAKGKLDRTATGTPSYQI